MEGRSTWMLSLLTVLGFLGLVRQASAQGCFWISQCQNRWIGGCPTGYAAVDISGDCQGLCNKPDYMECPPFFTRFMCCSAGGANPFRPNTTSCDECSHKVDAGDEWLCCSDCTEPVITNLEEKTGYCLKGWLNFQPKPREIYKWTTNAWTKCSGACKKGLRTRNVKCLLYVENAKKPAVVSDDKCLAATKPASEERCFPQGCLVHPKRRGMPAWAKVLISLFTVVAVGALAFAGFMFYKRQMGNDNHGFVYVMMEGY